MDYFTDLLATFLDVDRVNYIAVYERLRERSECIKNILLCVPKTTEAFTGLEGLGGYMINDNIFVLGWSNPLSSVALSDLSQKEIVRRSEQLFAFLRPFTISFS